MGLFRIQKCVHLFHFKRSFFKTGTRDLPIFGLRAQTHSGFGSHRDSEAGKASPKATKVNATDRTGRDEPPCDRRNAVACGPPVAPPAEESRRPSRSSPTLGGPRLFSTGDFLRPGPTRPDPRYVCGPCPCCELWADVRHDGVSMMSLSWFASGVRTCRGRGTASP